MSPQIAKFIDLAKKKILLSVSLAVSVVLLIFAYFRLGSTSDLENQLEEKTDELQRYENNIKYSALLDSDLKQITEANRQIETMLARPGDLTGGLQYFYKLEAAAHVKLTALKENSVPGLAKGQKKPPFLSIPFSVGIETTYDNLFLFLQLLKTGDRVVRLTSLNIKPLADSDNYSVSMNLEILGR